jgi:hypothetical protein
VAVRIRGLTAVTSSSTLDQAGMALKPLVQITGSRWCPVIPCQRIALTERGGRPVRRSSVTARSPHGRTMRDLECTTGRVGISPASGLNSQNWLTLIGLGNGKGERCGSLPALGAEGLPARCPSSQGPAHAVERMVTRRRIAHKTIARFPNRLGKRAILNGIARLVETYRRR